jgi:predicted GNAT family acetyltransferase
MGATRAGLLEYRAEPAVVVLVHTEIDPAVAGQGLGDRWLRVDARRSARMVGVVY